MYSKNNKYMQEQKSANRAQRFSLRKLSIGTVSVLLGTLMFFSNGQVSADTTTGKDTSADTASVNSAANDTSASAVTLSSANSSAASSAAASSAAASAQTATAAAAATSTTDSSQAASTASSAASSASAATTDASTATTANSQAASDDAASAEGKITDEGKAKGLTDSDVTPGMSDANGASVVADESNIPSGYKADPTDGRYTFGIVSLGGDFDKWGVTDSSKFKTYNGENNTHYYIRLSTSKNATNGIYDDTVYVQVVDATTDTVKWERALTPNSGAVKVNNGVDGFELTSLVNNVTQYYEITYTNTKVGTASTSRISINPNNGSLTALAIYTNGKIDSNPTPGTYTAVTYPAAGTIKTEYIAKDAAGNETILATYEETGREGYKYTASDSREFKGYDLISTPSSTTGNLAKTYHVGDVYVSGNLELSDQLQLARVYVVTSDDGYARVELRVALKEDANGNAITINSIDDSSIWKTIFSTDSLAPGAFASNGNNGSGKSWYINSTNGTKYITDAGFTEEQLTGYKKHLTVIVLANGLYAGQEPVQYYYAPQGQVRINYVTSDGTVIQTPVTAYENSSNNTAYDVSGSIYKPETITVNGKTYRYVKSDKSMGTADTTTVNGYTYNVTPSDETGRISSNNVNDVYYVYVTYHTEAETKDVTRTIEYYDSVTGEPIPSNLESTVTQTATLTRNKIYDDQNNFIGYGTISADGSSYTIDDSWKVDAQTWTQQDSANLSDYGYTAPDRASVAAVTVDGDTTNVTEKVYYGHQTTPVTPTDPKTPGEPINPKGDVTYPDGVAKDDLTATVKRTINYVDENGNKVNGAPDGTSSYVQTAEFTRTAIVDKVTGKILGYDTNNDGKVDTESADRAWTPIEKTLDAVKSADPSSVGYDNVDIANVSSLVVTAGEGDTTVTVTYSNNQVSGTIKYIDDTTGVELDSDNLPSGKIGSKINYTTADKIKAYEDQGYE
ncbi:mucin-binding protein, partial [Limosilactobacillus reuteri]|uniref:mucin-binding protein n=1 Tax=Limosilactobacillus reuteri TaxID=1598 RepID=UPI0011AFA6C5